MSQMFSQKEFIDYESFSKKFLNFLGTLKTYTKQGDPWWGQLGEGRKVRMFFNLVDKALLAGSGNQFPEKNRCFHDNNAGSSRSPGLVLQSFPVPFSSGPSRNLYRIIYYKESVRKNILMKHLLFLYSSCQQNYIPVAGNWNFLILLWHSSEIKS